MSITATELKNNLGKYLLLAATEEVYITRNGKTIAKLTSPYQNKLNTVESLFGSVIQGAIAKHLGTLSQHLGIAIPQ